MLLGKCGRQQGEIQELQLRANLGEIYLKCNENKSKILYFKKKKKQASKQTETLCISFKG